jgi:hypothetical protein
VQHRLLLIAAIALALAGCSAPGDAPTAPAASAIPAALSAAPHHGTYRQPHGSLPDAELQRARRATARYHDIRNAVADGYVDINVVIPNMGRHFLKGSLVDAKFEADRPELLVYSPHENGRMELVAVEYAVPLDLSAAAPEGFRGAADEWFADQRFGLWTLHAWAWKDNPDGVFSPTNTVVP